MTRLCNKCRIAKPLESFSVDNSQPLGRRYSCRDCSHVQDRQWYNVWAKNNRDKIARKNYRAGLKRMYDLTEADVRLMRQQQDNTCAICPRNLAKKTNIDHLHGTRIVRGLLCSRCNNSLGALEEEGWLESALKYLHKPHLKVVGSDG